MNDIRNPSLSLAAAHARLTAPGQPFETQVVSIRGRPVTVWTHVPATAAALFAALPAFGPREFLVLGETRVTYDGFIRAVTAVARDLAVRGVVKGDRVAVAMKNCPEWPVAFMAVLLVGAIAVPLNAWWTAEELAYAVTDSGARVVFADDERRGRFTGVTVLDVETIAGPARDWALLPDMPPPGVPLEPEDDATIFYTSGTSGAPKGALGTHRSLTTNIFAAPFATARNALRYPDMGAERKSKLEGIEIETRAPHFAARPSAHTNLPPPLARSAPEGEVVSTGEGDLLGAERKSKPEGVKQKVQLLAVPFFHVVGSLSVLLPLMAAGGKLVLMPRFDPKDALDLIARERVTVTGGVPAIALALLKQMDGHDLSSLELVTYGGAPCPDTLAARIHDAFGCWPGQGWGMTETSATCTTHSGPDYLARPASCGPALPVSRLKVMSGGVELPPGTVGELWAYGPNMVKGYWNKPEASAETFQDGWVRTGDLASLDDEGFVTIHDRAHDMVIRGGENIYCTEVENILVQHPAVADAALVGLPHPLLGEVPAALVQARGPVSAEALRDFVGARLAPYKVPVDVRISDLPLPRNENGKLLKRDMRKLFAS